jgi:glycosyltransferase involved in cell wall biosynthesis
MSYACALSQRAAGYHSVLCLESAPAGKVIKINKLKVAVVAACPFPVPRGTPIRILRLAEAVAERGHEVHVVTYHLGSGPVADAVRVHRIADIPGYRKLGPGPTLRKLVRVDPALAMLLRKLHQRERFDVIHAHHFEGLLVGVAARLGRRVPLVFDAHTLLMSELPYYPMGLPTAVKATLGRWGDQVLPRLADHTICVTDTIRDKLVGQIGLDPTRVSVISNGVELDHFDPARLEPTSGRVGKRLIFTGNLAEYQGIDLMLRAFRRVIAQVPEARLCIATNSPFEPYEALARQLGVRERIDLVPSPGYASLPAMLAGADIALNPRPVCDGIPVKLLNYMATARPAVSFAGSAPGVTHGVNGWLAASGDVEAFAAGVVALLQDPVRADAIGRAGRDYVVEHCTWPKAAERCEKIFQSLRARTT